MWAEQWAMRPDLPRAGPRQPGEDAPPLTSGPPVAYGRGRAHTARRGACKVGCGRAGVRATHGRAGIVTRTYGDVAFMHVDSMQIACG